MYLSPCPTPTTTAEYTYNAQGLRITKKVNGQETKHIWDGSNMVMELDGSDQVIDKYIRGNQLIKSDLNGYYLHNAHGDVIQLADQQGTITRSYLYDAFGIEQGTQPNDPNPFRYCGEYLDNESGNVYLRAKYYDPNIVRFISEDSVEGKVNEPLSLNLYTYCGNDPVMNIDPSGNVWWNPFSWFTGDSSDDSSKGKSSTKKKTKTSEGTGNGRLIDPSKIGASAAGIAFIKNYEEGGTKPSLIIYDANPPHGDWTIGWGHKIQPGENFDGGITEEQANKIFNEDLNRMINTTFKPFLEKYNIRLTQQQADALLSFTFQFGQNTWSEKKGEGYDTIKNFVKNGDYSETSLKKAYTIYMGKNQLVGSIARRKDEIEMFVSHDYNRDY